VKRVILCLTVAGFLAVPASSVATTLPNSSVIVDVLFTNQRTIVAYYQGETLGNGTPGYQAFVGTIARGSFLHFKIFNRSSKPHQFTAFGKTTPVIKPGKNAYFNKLAKVRGKFPYRDVLTKKPKAYPGSTGTFVIA